MKVIQAKSAGFCYGVQRAVELAEQTARERGGCVMLGSIIHNAHVVQHLEQLGAHQVAGPEEIRPGDTRSEERRVGKECRSRWSPYH